jgi:rhodanese-related sulfurtransferase
MKNKLLKMSNILFITSIFFGLAFTPTIKTKEIMINNEPATLTNNTIFANIFDDYTNLTAEEAWNLLNSTSNGIQIPIDVRTNQEWINWHIDTPYPEHPRHHILTDLEDPVKLQEFMELYDGKEIIIYCHSGVRSYTATNILITNNFTGKIYHIPVGITGWSAAGYPTVGNRNPNTPTITGPPSGKPGTKYTFTIMANDPDYDIIYLCVNWSDESGEVCVGPYESGEEVTLSHTWTEKGTFMIKSKASDRYGNESEEVTFDISIPRDKINYMCFLQLILDKCPFIKWLINTQ